jgi:nicotinamidase-related amidase
MNKALLIVDMQVMPFVWKDYGGKSIYNEQVLLENTQVLIERAHEAKTLIYYILYTEAEGTPRGKGQPLWQVLPPIAPQNNDRIITKYYADSFLKTELHDHLQKNNIDTIVICGLQTEFCIDTTVRSAYSHGYHVILAKDAHSTFDSEILTAPTIISHHNMILMQFADIIKTKEIYF